MCTGILLVEMCKQIGGRWDQFYGCHFAKNKLWTKKGRLAWMMLSEYLLVKEALLDQQQQLCPEISNTVNQERQECSEVIFWHLQMW